MLDRERYLDAIEAEAGVLLEAVRQGPDREVPTCPGWDAERLLRHVTGLHRWVATLVEQAPNPVDQRSLGPVPKGLDLMLFAEGFTGAVVRALRDADPEAPVQSWAGEVTTMWWCRRLAHETAVHRQDAQLAAATGATVDPVDADLAIDGVDESLTLFLPLRYNADEFGAAGSVHLHATDAEGEWIVRLGDSLEVEREHAKGDAAARGSGSDLFSVLWHRQAPEVLDVLGDGEVFDRFLRFTCA